MHGATATGLAPVTDASAILGPWRTARGCHVMRKRRSDDPRKWHGMSLTSLRLLSKAHRRNSPSSIRANNAHLLPSCETLVQNALTTGTRYKANKAAILTWPAVVCYHLRCTSMARVSMTEGCADKAADNASMSSAGYVPHPRSDRRDGRPPETSHTTSTTSPPLHAACSQELAELGSLQTSYISDRRSLEKATVRTLASLPRVPPTGPTRCVSRWRAHRLPQDLDTLTLYPEAHGQNLHGKIYRNIGCSSALWCRGEIRTALSGERLRRHHQRKDFCRWGGA